MAENNDNGTQAASVSYCAVSPPENFNYRQPDSWLKWKTRFNRYRSISGLSTRDQPSQIDALIYTMGEGAEDIFSALHLTPEERLSYAEVIARLDAYFLPKKNVIFERAQFNRRCQEPFETVDAFVTDLHRLADTCDFGPLREELVRDRVVVGLLDAKLSESLQLDPALTLEIALSKARSSEAIKKQQSVLRGTEGQKANHVDAFAVRQGNKSANSFQKRKQNNGNSGRNFQLSTQCNWCGSTQSHTRKLCPAFDKVCSKCTKKGHFARVCKSTPVDHREKTQKLHRGPAHLEEVFIGSVSGAGDDLPWFVNALVEDVRIQFKVDTGADVTVLTEEDFTTLPSVQLQPPDKVLLAPARIPLDTLGYFKAQLAVRGRSSQQQIYVVRNLQQSLMGRPAIRALQVLAHIRELSSDKAHTPQCNPRDAFPSLFWGLGCLADEHAYKIKLKADAEPFAVTAPRRIPIPLLPQVKAELQRMVQLGVIKPVREATEWCAPMVIAWKREGQIRICCGFESLNKQLIRERTVMPIVEESLAQLADAKVFSKIDARSGFWQIPLDKESQKLTTFITPFGRYTYLRLPFGISSAPEHFQRVMSQLLDGLPGQVCQLDDILVHGRNQKEHDDHLLPVLERLQNSGLTLNRDKCEFSQREVTFLGHILNSNGVSADPRKIKAICEMAPPTDVRGVRAFLGMVNHLAKFLPGLANKTKPLRDLLHVTNEWVWGPSQQSSFSQIRRELVQPPVLALYDPTKPYVVSADASSYGLGGVLLQVDDHGNRKPVAYASRSITDTEKRYAQVEKEALAAVWACARFRSYLVGLQFTIETDHKPLLAILGTKRLDELTPRLQRLRMKIMEYSYDVVFVPGKEMHTADVLSRAPVDISDLDDADMALELKEHELLSLELLPCSDVRLTQIRSALNRDPVLRQVRDYCETNWPPINSLKSELKPYAEIAHELTFCQELLLRGNHLVIPASLRDEVLDRLHEGHQGITRTRARASQSVWWPGVSAQIADYVRACPTCCKYRRTDTEPLISTPLPERPWQMIGTDLLESKRTKYLIVVDYFSRFFELEPLKSTTAEIVVNKMKLMFARHGIPECIRSDNGPQFSSNEFALFCNEYGIRHITSSPTYPQSNGEVERTVQTAKNLIKKSKDLASGLLAYRSTPTAVGSSPAELCFGRRIRSTVPTLSKTLAPKWPNLPKFRRDDERAKAKQAANYNVRHRVRELSPLAPGAGVWIRGQHGIVLQQTDQPRSYEVETDAGILRRTRCHLQPRPISPVGTPETPRVNEASQDPNLQNRTRSGRPSRPPQRLNL